MDIFNIIAVLIFVVAVGGIISIRIYQNKKTNPDMTIEDVIDTYGDQIIRALTDTIDILQINIEEFETQEEYEKTIISTTIQHIKDNALELEMDATIVNMLDTEMLTQATYQIMHNNLDQCQYNLKSNKMELVVDEEE